MELVFNIIVLIFEVLYYSLFMKFAKKDGKFWKYLLLFVINSIIVALCSSTKLPVYLIFIFTTLLGLKYFVKAKTSFYDMLIIIIMLFLNVLIELPVFLIFYKLLNLGHFITTLIFEVLKIVVIVLLRNVLNKVYIKLKVLWDNNNFYIRYIFSCSMFIYVIITAILLIKLLWEV